MEAHASRQLEEKQKERGRLQQETMVFCGMSSVEMSKNNALKNKAKR
jgi:hypothetical protein